MFEGLKKLENLDFQYVEVSRDELEALISRCPLLKRLKLRNLGITEPELELMKFLLTSTPNLQKLTIRPNSTSGEGKLLKELLQSRRASAQAEVTFPDPVDPEASLR
ncbi:hypothetical protein NL676_025745 [Syzygium grande]|nr:hypothetical protein NL676_025745 [Syzygium grande]